MVHEHILTPATVQVGDGVTICYWSDRHAATVIKKTPLSLTVRRDKATLDPSFKPEWIPAVSPPSAPTRKTSPIPTSRTRTDR